MGSGSRFNQLMTITSKSKIINEEEIKCRNNFGFSSQSSVSKKEEITVILGFYICYKLRIHTKIQNTY